MGEKDLENPAAKASLTWRDDLGTGIPLIDEQHRRIIEEVNGLVDSISRKSGKIDLERIFTHLMKYTTEHFETEEKYMLEYGYPEFQEHHAAHTVFVAEFGTMKDVLRANPSPFMIVQVAARIKMELTKHIETVDIPMAKFLRSKIG